MEEEYKFTTKDIQVGKIYLRHDYPGAKWIGAGKRKAYTMNEFTEKCLVCIQGEPGNSGMEGKIFRTPDDEDGCWWGDWDLFYLESEAETAICPA